MKELPDIPDMLATVREFLKRLGPSLDKGMKFEAQVAAYLLDIAVRELAAHPTVRIDISQLCADIRSGSLDKQWDEILDTELDAVVARVRIVRPKHLEGAKP
jgi:hypothetical protein